MAEKKRLPAWTRILLGVIGLLAALVLGFIVWGSTPARPASEALAALQPDAQVMVENGRWLTFRPAGTQPTVGFIFYPGGRVDYRAYAPAAHAIAAKGYLTVIVRMPLNLAVLDPGAAAEVIAAHPEIDHWAVGGHSLGGSMTANFAKAHPGLVEGLVLWASYPATSDDLSASGLQVVSISGTADGLATLEKIAASVPLLPPDTTWVRIEGGNHAQFGWYGPQAGDNPAAISHQDQSARVIRATLDLLSRLK